MQRIKIRLRRGMASHSGRSGESYVLAYKRHSGVRAPADYWPIAYPTLTHTFANGLKYTVH